MELPQREQLAFVKLTNPFSKYIKIKNYPIPSLKKTHVMLHFNNVKFLYVHKTIWEDFQNRFSPLIQHKSLYFSNTLKMYIVLDQYTDLKNVRHYIRMNIKIIPHVSLIYLDNTPSNILRYIHTFTPYPVKVIQVNAGTFTELIHRYSEFTDDIYEYIMFIHSNWIINGDIPSIIQGMHISNIINIPIVVTDQYTEKSLIFKSSKINMDDDTLQDEASISPSQSYLQLIKHQGD